MEVLGKLEYTPEVALFFQLAHPQLLDSQKQHALELVSNISEWDDFFGLCQHHRLSVLVCQNLRLIAPDVFQQDQFNLSKYSGMHEHLARQAVQKKIGNWFCEKKLAIVAFKSSQLAGQLYVNAFFREARDLDFLVAKVDWLAAVNLLMDKGYIIHHESVEFKQVDDVLIERWLSVTDQVMLVSPEGVLVELHHRLSRWHCEFPVDDTWIWQDTWLPDEQGIPLLSAEKIFIYSCYHGTKHYWFRYHWLLDLSLMLERLDLNWKWIEQESKRLGMTRFVAISLRLLMQIKPIEIPSELKSLMKNERQENIIQMTSYLTRCPVYSPDDWKREQSVFSVWFRGYYFRSNLQTRWLAKLCIWSSFLRPTLAEAMPNSGGNSSRGLFLWLNRVIRVVNKYLIGRSK